MSVDHNKFGRRSVWGRLAARRTPLLLAGAYLGLAVWYGAFIPIFEASDENNHFFFARQLALTGRIPNVRYETGPWGQQATQGPLFYVTAALPIRFLETGNALDLIAHFNPQVNLGDGSRPGNKNAWVHDPRREAWPWRGAVLAVHIARWVSALYGALTIWFVYEMVRNLSPRAAGTAAALAAFLPQFIWAGGAVTNETAVAAASALSLWLLVSAPAHWPKRHLISLGAALGLAALAKTPGLILAAYVMGVMLIRALPDGWPTLVRRMGLIALAFGLVAGPWLALNTVRYGDPTGLTAHLAALNNSQAQLFRADSLGSLFAPQFTRLIPGYIIAAFVSFWGVFGLHNILAPATVYGGFNNLAWLGLLGFCLSLFWPVGKQQPASRGWQLWLGGWLALHLITLALWAYRSGGGPGRLLFPALPVIVFICAAGWLRWAEWLRVKPLARALRGLFPALLGIFALIAPAWLIAPAYAVPPVVAELPPTARALDVHYGDLELVGVEAQPQARPNDNFDVTFYWKLARPTALSYLIFPRLLDANLTPVAGTNSYPGWGNWPVGLWQPGLIYADRYRLPVAADAVRPGAGRLIMSVEADRVGQPPTIISDGRQLDPIWPLATIAFPPEPSRVESPPIAVFGDAVALIAADIPANVHPGETVQVGLTWLAQRPPLDEWQRFVHLDSGDPSRPKLTAQGDGVPANGYSTLWWQSGDVIPDTVRLTLPGDLLPGRYALWVGFFDPAGARITITGGHSQDERLYLGAIVAP